MLISGEQGKGGVQQNGQSRVQQVVAGKVPLLDDTKHIDMKRAAAYLAQLNINILNPCRERLLPLLENMKDDVNAAGRGAGDISRIAVHRAGLVEINNWLMDAIVEERDSLVGGEFETERGTLSNFEHYARTAFSTLPSNLRTLEMKMQANSDKTLVAANMILDGIRQKEELLAVLGKIRADDEKSASMLFFGLEGNELVSALHKTVKHDFDGKLLVCDEQYGGGNGLHMDTEARDYLRKALRCIIRTNEAIKPEKERLLALLDRLEAGETVAPELRAAFRETLSKIDARSSFMDKKTPEWIAHDWTLKKYITNETFELLSTLNLGMPAALADKISTIRMFFALLDGLKRNSLYEMKVLLENQTLDDAMQKLA